MPHRRVTALFLGLLLLPCAGQDLPALIEQYEKAAPKKRYPVVLSIARLETEASRAWLRERLANEKDEVARVQLVNGLGTDGHRSNGAVLLGLLKEDPPYRVGSAALYALGRLDGDWGEELRRIAEASPNSSMRYAAVNALAQKKDDASFEVLARFARGDEVSLRSAAISALGRSWPLERLRPLFDSILAGGEGPAVSQVVSILLQKKSPRALEVIRPRVSDSSLGVYAQQWVLPLAAYDSVEALELMAAIVREGPPRAAANFGRALREMKAPAVLDWLRQSGLRSENEEVALASKRRLFATGAPQDEALALQLARGRDKGLAVEAIDALARFEGAKVSRFLGKLVRHRDPELASAALVSLWHQSGRAQDVRKDLERAARRSRTWQMRLVATELLAEEAAKHEELLVRKLEDKHPLVRAAAYEALTSIRERRIVTLLIERIGKERDRRAGEALASALFDLTNFDYGLREDQWRKWWERVGEEYPIPPKPKEKRRSLRGGARAYARYYGIDVNSDRVAFVIDISGSMGSTGTGPSKLRIAKDNLIGVLKTFSPRTRFNVIAFHSVPQPWEKQLIPAGRGQKAEAEKWVNALQATGGTNIYDSLVQAMELPEVDTIFLLSDGAPGAGEVVDPDEILRRISRRNRLRRIRINTVGIGLGGVAREFMEKLAAQNYGESVAR